MNSSKVTYFKNSYTVMTRGDKINGKYTEYWSNGKKHMECTYTNGKINGKYTEYWPNGKKQKECTCTNGKSNDDFILFDKTGKIVYDNENCHCDCIIQ